MKHRILFVASLLLLLSTGMHARRVIIKKDPMLIRLDAVYRLVSQGTTFADGQQSGLLGKRLAYGQYAPKQKLAAVKTERYSWNKSTGRWGYTAGLGSFTSAGTDKRTALQQKTIRTLNEWASRMGVEPTDLSNTASKGPNQTIWIYSDAETKTLVSLVSQYSKSAKATALVVRVEAM